MTPRVKIVTDSTCDLSSDIVEKYDIKVVPAYVNFGDKSFRDGINITYDDFYKRLLEDKTHPKTAAASPGNFLNTYLEVVKDKNIESIVAITVTKELSGMYQSAINAANQMNEMGYNVHVINSTTTTMGLGFIIMVAAEEAMKGKSSDEIIKIINDTIPRVDVYAVLDTLKYLEKGGRIKKSARIFGSVLNIKPIIRVKDDGVTPYKRFRSFDGAIKELYDICVNSGLERLAVMYSTDGSKARSLAKDIKEAIKIEPYIGRITPALGTHVGPGALGIALLKNEP